MSVRSKTRQSLSCPLAGAGLTLLATWLFLVPPLFQGLQHLSYNLPFRLRPHVPVTEGEVMIVYMDDESHSRLRQPSASAWDRKLHAQLVGRLAAAGVRAIAFDVFFENANTNDSAADLELLEAARAHGRVLFAAVPEAEKHPVGLTIGRAVRRPFQGLADPGRFPCLSSLECLGVVETALGRPLRRHHSGTRQIGTLAWNCAQFTMADPPRDPLQPRWINYYGPADSIPHVSFHRVWRGEASTSLTLSNKIVFVGSSLRKGPTGGSGTDWLPTPYGTDVPGVDINATICLNLLREDWLRGLSPMLELVIFSALALLLGYGLAAAQPMTAAALGLGGVVCIFLLNYLLFCNAHFWFAWALPCAVQVPCALAWSVLVHTKRLTREKGELEGALRAGSVRPAPIGAAEGVPALATLHASAVPAVPIPDHTLLRAIGQGAYGEVWLARNAIGMFRAVKIVHRKSFAKNAPYEREFKGIERFMPVSLGHPSLVHLFHVGRREDYFYSIMELADDSVTGQRIDPERYTPRSLSSELERRSRIPAEECLALFLPLTSALDFLHRQKLVHRDIKPANIIFVGGVPKLADIGLVTDIASRGLDISFVGTQGYIPPEGPGFPTADIYSLGKVIYQACMGRDRELYPELPTTITERPDLKLLLEMDTILHRACHTDPNARYQSAAELHDALERLQSH